MPSLRRAAAVSAILAVSSSAPAQDPGAIPADKSGFSLVNPTPRHLRRAMSTDRPDTTESPYTVDAGAVQLEMSFIDFASDDRGAGARTDTLAIAPFNLKIGLLNTVDLQFVLDPWVRVHEAGAPDADGPGNLAVRCKINLWGNDDEEGSALALMPFVSLPTGDDDVAADQAEGGLIVPLALSLGGGWALGLMAELDIVDDGPGHAAECVHTATVGHDLIGPLAGYVEYVGIAPLEAGGDYRALVSAGLTLGIGEDVQLDAGVRIGLTGPDTEDWAVFAGISVRF